MSIAEKLTQIAENEQRVFEAGKNAVFDRFWDVYQNNGKRSDYAYAFGGAGWTDELYKPKYVVKPQWYCTAMYALSKITDTKVAIECGDNTTMASAFNGCSNMITIPLLRVTSGTAYAGTFNNCAALENLTVEGTIGKNDFNVKDSTKLSKDSITSIINALSSTTSGLSITLSKTAVNNAFGINVDDSTTYPEGSEYYTLRHSKNNWTINYM